MASDKENASIEQKASKINAKSNCNKKLIMIIAEFIGTACLVFFGCMGCMDWIKMPGKKDH